MEEDMNERVMEKGRDVGGEFPNHEEHKVCPWWMGYFLDNPLRRLLRPAEKTLGPYVRPGMAVLDLGCGFGFFSLGMARLVGPEGVVAAVDVQRKMLDKTMARARRKGLDGIILPVLTDGRGIGEGAQLDFALAGNSLHEAPDPGALVRLIYDRLRPGGRFLFMEPKMHLKDGQFEAEVALAGEAGFVVEKIGVAGPLSALCRKSETPRERRGGEEA